jgi:hypothetical protein
VEKLPNFLPESNPTPERETVRATGTDAAAVLAYTPLTQTPDATGVRLMADDGSDEGKSGNTAGLNALQLQGCEASRGLL